MKIFPLLFAIVILNVLTYAYGVYRPIYNLHKAPKLFAKFVKKYHRHYKGIADIVIHYEAFKKSLHKINKYNSGPHNPADATFGITEFADYTEKELKKHKGLLPSPN